MPLPSIAGADDNLMAGAGMTPGSAAPTGDPGSQQVTPQDQAKGAVEVLSKLRTTTQQQIEAIAQQFPPVSKAAKQFSQALDQALQGLIKEIIKTTQSAGPEAGPRLVR